MSSSSKKNVPNAPKEELPFEPDEPKEKELTEEEKFVSYWKQVWTAFSSAVRFWERGQRAFFSFPEQPPPLLANKTVLDIVRLIKRGISAANAAREDYVPVEDSGFVPPPGAKDDRRSPAPPWGNIAGIGAAVVLLLILAFNSTYQIGEQEQAVLITFGQASPVTEPGLHFKIPFIQEVRKVNTTIQGFSIGYAADAESYP